MEKLLSYFGYQHLPERLQAVSKPFHDLAHKVAELPGDANERLQALRKLLEAKDCAVRAMI